MAVRAGGLVTDLVTHRPGRPGGNPYRADSNHRINIRGAGLPVRFWASRLGAMAMIAYLVRRGQRIGHLCWGDRWTTSCDGTNRRLLNRLPAAAYVTGALPKMVGSAVFELPPLQWQLAR